MKQARYLYLDGSYSEWMNFKEALKWNGSGYLMPGKHNGKEVINYEVRITPDPAQADAAINDQITTKKK